MQCRRDFSFRLHSTSIISLPTLTLVTNQEMTVLKWNKHAILFFSASKLQGTLWKREHCGKTVRRGPGYSNLCSHIRSKHRKDIESKVRIRQAKIPAALPSLTYTHKGVSIHGYAEYFVIGLPPFLLSQIPWWDDTSDMTEFAVQYWWLTCRGWQREPKRELVIFCRIVSRLFLTAEVCLRCTMSLHLQLLHLEQILALHEFFSVSHQWVPKTRKKRMLTTDS